jgi:hypothetical protein
LATMSPTMTDQVEKDIGKYQFMLMAESFGGI